MRFLGLFLIAIYIFAFSFNTTAAEENIQKIPSAEYLNDIKQLQQNSKTTINDIEILRRDQINYKIEKDLLKEAYSSNLESINLTITIVLGVIGVFGYLGIRSIKEVRADYVNELDNLKKLKISFENELQVLSSKQKQFEGQVGELAKTNEEQNQRLKTLELIEKISDFIRSGHWEWALEYISVGLVADPKNVMLLSQKVTCCYKLGRFNLAIDVSKLILEIDSRSVNTAMNLAELLALENREKEFASIYQEYKSEINEQYDGNLIIYLKMIANCTKGSLDTAKAELNQFANKFPPDEVKPKLGKWSFDETLQYVSKLPENETKHLMTSAMQFFQGQLSTNAFKEAIK